MDLDPVQGKMQFGGAFFAVLPTELVLLALEPHHFLMRRVQQRLPPDRLVMRIVVVRHDPGSQSFGSIHTEGWDREKVRCRRITET